MIQTEYLTPYVPQSEALEPVLYTPATNPAEKLLAISNGEDPRIQSRRWVVDTEDAIGDTPEALERAHANLKFLAQEHNPENGVRMFVRVRDLGVLKRVLDMDRAEAFTGFVIPKAHADDFPDHAQLIKDHDSRFRIMPIIEHRDMFDYAARKDLRQVLAAYRESIDCVRLGGNDLHGLLGGRHSRKRTIWETAGIGTVLGTIIGEFKGLDDFIVTAPVFEPRGSRLLVKEVQQSVETQILGQTVVHPPHVALIREQYKPTVTEVASAQRLLDENAAAVSCFDDRMDEVGPLAGKWAPTILARAERFGIRTERQQLTARLASFMKSRIRG